MRKAVRVAARAAAAKKVQCVGAPDTETNKKDGAGAIAGSGRKITAAEVAADAVAGRRENTTVGDAEGAIGKKRKITGAAAMADGAEKKVIRA